MKRLTSSNKEIPSLKDNAYWLQVYFKLKEYEELEEHNNDWIPFTQRELTKEEREIYGDEIGHMLDCKLPEENEEVLITYKFKGELYVDTDTFLRDGSACYLDSGREFIEDAVAWMPLPKPYKEKQKFSDEKLEKVWNEILS